VARRRELRRWALVGCSAALGANRLAQVALALFAYLESTGVASTQAIGKVGPTLYGGVNLEFYDLFTAAFSVGTIFVKDKASFNQAVVDTYGNTSNASSSSNITILALSAGLRTPRPLSRLRCRWQKVARYERLRALRANLGQGRSDHRKLQGLRFAPPVARWWEIRRIGAEDREQERQFLWCGRDTWLSTLLRRRFTLRRGAGGGGVLVLVSNCSRNRPVAGGALGRSVSPRTWLHHPALVQVTVTEEDDQPVAPLLQIRPAFHAQLSSIVINSSAPPRNRG